VKDELTIQVDEKMIGATIELLDLNGRLLTTSIIEKTSSLFDISIFPSGTYFLQINNSGVQQLKTVVVD
jgi:hypothetical protein